MNMYDFEFSLGFVGMSEYPTIVPYPIEAKSFLSAFRKFKMELPEYFRAIISVTELSHINIKEEYSDFVV